MIRNEQIQEQRNTELDSIFGDVCEKIQLTPTQRGILKSAYNGVGGVLTSQQSPIKHRNPDIKPHGSVLLEVPVKPLAGEYFDVDLLCLLAGRKDEFGDGSALYSDMATVLRSFDRYRENVDCSHDYCIRIDYSEQSKFYLDLVPAIPHESGHGLWIPKKNGGWKWTAPLEYAEWFENQSRKDQIANFARVEPLPADKPSCALGLLRQVCQLLKRARDVHFEKDAGNSVKSILLTTLIAHFYQGGRFASVALVDVLNRINDWAGSCEEVPRVSNPVLNGELLSRHWNAASFKAFKEFIGNTLFQVNELRGASGTTLHTKLGEIFGTTLTHEVLVERARRIEAARRSGGTRQQISGPILRPAFAATAAAATLSKVIGHEFFGDVQP